MLAVSLLLATGSPAVAVPAERAASESKPTVVRLGPRSGKLKFQAFSRLTDPFGDFGSWRGEVSIPNNDLSRASVMIRVEVSTINTDNTKRDTHLRNADFFNVLKWPVAVFNARGLKPLGNNRYRVSGQLKMMGKTKALSFPATILWRSGKLSVKADFRIDRTLWGMTGYLSAFGMNPIKKGVRVLFDLKT